MGFSLGLSSVFLALTPIKTELELGVCKLDLFGGTLFLGVNVKSVYRNFTMFFGVLTRPKCGPGAFVGASRVRFPSRAEIIQRIKSVDQRNPRKFDTREGTSILSHEILDAMRSPEKTLQSETLCPKCP